jgi:hypothetical protein
MASTNIQRTLGQNSNSGKLTISVWVKRAGLGEQGICGSWYSGTYHGILYFGSNDQLFFYDYRNGYIMRKITTAQFRDVGAWYHIVCNFDHTLGSPTGKIYVNGVEQTLSTDINYTQGATSSWLTDYPFNIGSYDGSSNYFNGNMSDFYFIQGYVYEASTFGETDATTGIWKPITQPTVNYSSTGNNSCHLKFENSANMDLDSGDNNVSFTTTGNLTQTVDTPSNVFSTFNPLIYMPNIPTFENGNLYVKGHDANYCEAISTLSMTKKGKWYAEFKKIEINNSFMVGIGNTNNIIEALRTNTNISESSGGYSGGAVTIRDAGDVRQTNASDISGFFPSSIANTNIIGLAIDLDNGAVYAHKNGTYGVISSVTGDPTSGASKTGAIDISGQAWYQNADFICFLFGNISSATKDWCQANFGNGYFGTTPVASAGLNGNGAIFEYDVPTGYYALNTKNINTYG